jgi:hypothetical protein
MCKKGCDCKKKSRNTRADPGVAVSDAKPNPIDPIANRVGRCEIGDTLSWSAVPFLVWHSSRVGRRCEDGGLSALNSSTKFLNYWVYVFLRYRG